MFPLARSAYAEATCVECGMIVAKSQMKRHRGSGTCNCFRERKECKRLAEQQFQPLTDISVYGEKVEWVK